MLMTLFYHYIALLYLPGDKNLQEIEWEQRYNAVCRHSEHTKSRTDGASAFGHRE